MRKEVTHKGISVVPSFSSGDLVDAPSHYVGGREIDPILVIEDWGLSHHLACALKYICRAGRKGDEVLDLRKAIWYLRRREAVLADGEVGCSGNKEKEND